MFSVLFSVFSVSITPLEPRRNECRLGRRGCAPGSASSPTLRRTRARSQADTALVNKEYGQMAEPLVVEDGVAGVAVAEEL